LSASSPMIADLLERAEKAGSKGAAPSGSKAA